MNISAKILNLHLHYIHLEIHGNIYICIRFVRVFVYVLMSVINVNFDIYFIEMLSTFTQLQNDTFLFDL